jgi:hypothetical protein
MVPSVRRVSESTSDRPALASTSEDSICGIALASRNAGGITPSPAAALIRSSSPSSAAGICSSRAT